MVISLLRFYQRAFSQKNVTNLNRDLVKGHEVNSSKIGIIGLGRIGSHLVNYFKNNLSIFFYGLILGTVPKFFYQISLDNYFSMTTFLSTIFAIIISIIILIILKKYEKNL